MKRIKRVIALVGVVLFVCNAPTTAYAKADNFVLNTGAVVELITSAFASTPQGALVVTLGLLGITAGGAVCENRDEILNWGQKRLDELNRWIDRTGEELSITADAMEMWLTDVGNGMLDTTSECWDAFLDYCCWLDGEISSSQESSGTTDITWTSVDGVQEFVNTHASDFGEYGAFSSKDVYVSEISKSYTQFYENSWMTFTNDYVTFVRLPGDQYTVIVTSLDYDVTNLNNTGAFSWRDYTSSLSKMRSWFNNEEGDYPVLSCSLITASYDYSWQVEKWYPYVDRWLDFSNVAFDNLYYARASKGLMGLVSGIALGWDGWCVEVPDVTPKEDVSDVVVAPDTSGIIDRDGSLDKVRVGDATGELVDVVSIPIDGIGVGDVVTPYVVVPGVYPVDTVTGEIVGTDTPIEDIKPGVLPSLNNDYTIADLQELFPFCVPYDLVNLFSCLKAERKAPCFKFPLPVPRKGGGFKYKEIEIDLSDFDAAARVLRVMELLAFCVGLTLATRKLIRG